MSAAYLGCRRDRSLLRAAVLLLGLLGVGGGCAWAQSTDQAAPAQSAQGGAQAGETQTLNQVIVTGSREPGVTAADSAAPVQIISPQALRAASGSPDLLSALAQLLPAFTLQGFGNDMAGQTLQAKLRGLSPNDVLVLVNGKRRHTTANIEVDSGPFQGGAGVDFDFIPLDAIDHIEVLTDGAAAQYGSDAIAGVINIILKKQPSGVRVDGTYGSDIDGGGNTGDVSANAGFAPSDNSFLNLTGEVHHHGATNRSAIDERVINPANLASYPDSNMTEVAGYPYLGAEEGDADYELKIFSLNSGLTFDDGTQAYAFATYGDKDAASYQKYRLPGKIAYTNPLTGITTYPYPFGFDPQEASIEYDYSATGGFKGTIAAWDWDLSTTAGSDHFDAYTLHSANAGLYASDGHPTPQSYYDGLLQTTQWTTTLDVNHDFEVGLAGPLNFAWGLEYRRDGYKIGAGVPASYVDGGAQSYPGFTPTDAGSHARDNEAVYVDFATQPLMALHVDAAGRYEHYSDFGSATVGKLTARYDFTPQVALRGTASTGFRAPTLAEEYYSSTSVTPSSAFVQLPPDSVGGKLLGLGQGLTPEHSVDFSFGVVWRPIPAMFTTLDFYNIDVSHRIVSTGDLYGSINGIAQPSAAAIDAAIAANGNQLDPSVLASGNTGVVLFANGIDTRTDGADLVFTFPVDYGEYGQVDWSAGATYNSTVVTRLPATPAQLVGLTLYDATALSDLTTASPKFVLNLQALWTWRRAYVNLQEQIYGPSSEWENDDGDNPSNQPEYFLSTVGAAPITNLEVGWHPTGHFQLAAGAKNLLDRYPDKYNGTLLAHYDNFKYGDTLGVFQYPMFSPFGIDGGYYYVRGSLTF
ncbi:MAG TPA: TonB-dependent receptor [Steroidobacteraceae bacterium]|nr:TonB-dependent receptor [Steroidobacteraceae bacterium]